MRTYFNIRFYCTSFRNYAKFQETVEFSNGRRLIFEGGHLAKLADGSAVASLGDTSVLVTSVSKQRNNANVSFMPLTVDYRQKYAAAGRIPSNYLRRELAPTEKEILTSRVIDRSIRPLFPSDFFHDTQLNCQLLAVDGMQEPDVIGVNAASASLSISNIPWNGPVGAVRVGLIDGEVVIFPTRKELSHSTLNMIVTASHMSHVVMLEGSADCILIQDMKKALKVAVSECRKIADCIERLKRKEGLPKREYTPSARPSEELVEAARSLCSAKLREVFSDFTHNKLSRDNTVNSIRLDTLEKLSESFPDPSDSYLFNDAFNLVTKDVFRSLILESNTRCDGRSLGDLRQISCDVDLFKPLHGSAIFQRGQTQVQCTVAFDSPDKAIRVDPLLEMTGGISDRNFLLHYSFPSFANNELSKGGPVSRREIGHGALAAKGLRAILPKDNPFCILLTSTVMESNGSSSMATVCGGSLALMDAGVDISSHAAGVAIGLVSKSKESGAIEDYKLLTDILGIEDYMGDMDFKIAGTKSGLTAIQADIKLNGVPLKIIMEAIEEGFQAKNAIISIMNATISQPRKDKKNLPVLINKSIPAHKRGALMAAGAIKLKKIQAESGVQITWDDANTLSLFATNKDSMDEAVQLLDESMQTEPVLEFGSIYTAKVIEVRPQGVMISLYDGMTPVLLHNSQLDVKKVHHPSVLNIQEGNEIKVKYFGRDPTSGHMRLSRRALLSTVPLAKNLMKKQEGNS